MSDILDHPSTPSHSMPIYEKAKRISKLSIGLFIMMLLCLLVILLLSEIMDKPGWHNLLIFALGLLAWFIAAISAVRLIFLAVVSLLREPFPDNRSMYLLIVGLFVFLSFVVFIAWLFWEVF